MVDSLVILNPSLVLENRSICYTDNQSLWCHIHQQVVDIQLVQDFLHHLLRSCRYASPLFAARLHIVFSNLNKKQYKTYAYQFFKLGFRVELQLICRKCHPHPHQMYILNLATDMEIINETIIAHQIIDMTILRLIEINNPEIIRMVLVFKTSNYNKHLTHVFVYFFFVYKCKYGAF